MFNAYIYIGADLNFNSIRLVGIFKRFKKFVKYTNYDY